MEVILESLSLAPIKVESNHPIGSNQTPRSCGGTLFEIDAVLTAAHCLFDFSSNECVHPQIIQVGIGNFSQPDWIKHVTWHSIYRYVTPSYYKTNPLFSPFDIALIRVNNKHPKNGVLKPCKMFGKQPENVHVLVLGIESFLRNSEGSEKFPDTLMGAVMERYRYCSRYFYESNVKIDESSQLCYGAIFSSGSPIAIGDGDAGSPLIAFTSNGELSCLLGVASFGESNLQNPWVPSVFTIVDAVHFWINKSIRLSDRRNIGGVQSTGVFGQRGFSTFIMDGS